MAPLMYRVAERHDESPDTATITLRPQAERIAAPLPGQFTMLWAFGIGEAPISLSRIGKDGSLVHTVRSVGAVTRALCALEPGDEVGVRGPFGSAWPLASAAGEDVLIVAGGLGLAPTRPIVDHVVANRASYKQCTVFVGARRPEALLYADSIDRWKHDHRIDVEEIVDMSTPTWTGHVGLITKLIANADLDPEHTHVFLCGPEPMMHFGALAALDRGVPREQVWLSLERNMQCAVVHCGHCQLGPLFLCRDGPVVAWPTVAELIKIPER